LPRQRNPNREKAKEIYLNSKGNAVLKDIAKELGVLDTQVRKWKSEDKWDVELKGTSKKNKRNGINKNVPNKKDKAIPDNIDKSSNEKNPGLTEKQRLFCIYWVNNRNATQAYLKAYGGSYDVANTEGPKNLVKPCIKAEISRLKQLKKDSLMIDGDDIVEMQMRIAFADIKDFMEFGNRDVPLITKDGPVIVKDSETGEEKPFMVKNNVINLKNDSMVDGNLISEISSSRQGIRLKLKDSQKALDWLADYFEMNPEHKLRKEFNDKKLQLEKERFEHQKKMDDIKIY
jgi:phage terminase small subunit